MMSLQFTSMSFSGISCQEGLKYLKKINAASFFARKKRNNEFIVGGTPLIMLIMKTIHLGKLAQQFLNLHGDSSMKLPNSGCFPQSSRPIKWSTACLGGFTWMAMKMWSHLCSHWHVWRSKMWRRFDSPRMWTWKIGLLSLSLLFLFAAPGSDH